MSATYIVIAINDGAELETCETYAGGMAAFTRALDLAKAKSANNPQWINQHPVAEMPSGNNIRWVYLDTNKNYVGVHYQNIMTSIPQTVDPLAAVKDLPSITSVPSAYMSKAVDDPGDRSLPGGFTFDNKPATMGDLLDRAADVKYTGDLSEQQKQALVLARLSKRPNFAAYIGGTKYSQAESLKELNAKSTAGNEIRRLELAWLDDIKIAQLPEESEDESSSSEEDSDY